MRAINIKYKIMIIIAVIIVMATSITCGIIFWPRDKEMTTQEWLNTFSESLERATMTKDSDGNAVEMNVEREIEIKENDVVVVMFRQCLQISIDEEGQVTAYLVIEEKYPTIEDSKDDVIDEYYLSRDIMYTRREKGGKTQSSHFDSNLDILLTVASENVGNAKYEFDEGGFLPLGNETEIIVHDGDIHRLAAIVKSGRYRRFFGVETNTEDMSDVEIQMQMTASRFDWLQINYKQNDLSSTIKITRNDIQPVSAPEWA